jgi:hypothetical protein
MFALSAGANRLGCIKRDVRSSLAGWPVPIMKALTIWGVAVYNKDLFDKFGVAYPKDRLNLGPIVRIDEDDVPLGRGRCLPRADDVDDGRDA